MKTANTFTALAASFLYFAAWNGQPVTIQPKIGDRAWKLCEKWSRESSALQSPLEIYCITPQKLRQTMAKIKERQAKREAMKASKP